MPGAMKPMTQRSPGRPLLLVDVDGVISLWGWPAAAPPAGTWALIDGIAHYLSVEAAQCLRVLRGSFELVWCTGWEDRANEHLPQAVGLGPFPHLSFEAVRGVVGSHAHWKLAAIDAWAGPDRALAWVDDAFNDASEAWAASRPGPTHLERTHPATGLTAEGAGRLQAFATALAGR
jgi:hypothetical protein